MIIDPLFLAPAERYKLLIGGILPRPIALVATLSPTGQTNLAPFSFFAGIGSNPMTLLFCPVNNQDGTEKDSLRNAKPAIEGGTGEFIVNVVSYSFRHKMAAAAEELPYGQSEFDLTGLTPAASSKVRPGRVQEAVMAFECVTSQVVRTNPGKPGAGNVVIGEVVSVYIRDDAVNERFHVDPSALDAIGRMGGQTYCTTRERFDLPRGIAAMRSPLE